MAPYVLAIDQGTTSSRAILFRRDVSIAAVAQQEFPQHFPAPGWVEHDPEDLWATTVATCRAALQQVGAAAHDVAAIGITNQRETTLLCDRRTGAPAARRARLRHGRFVSPVAPDGRRRACNRRDECRPHAPVRHPRG